MTLRRLSNTEYDNAIRDLTGVDMRPTQAREFPVDELRGKRVRVTAQLKTRRTIAGWARVWAGA